MFYGRKGIAPCGHPGSYIIGQFIKCDQGCDNAIPTYIDPEKTKRLCIHCGSIRIEIFPDFALNGKDIYYCNNCHRVFEVESD